MSNRNSPCLWTSVPQVCPAPCDRYKHASCAFRGNIYLLGGRKKHSLRDFWKYNVARNEWIELDCGGDQAPEELEEHSMVAHQGVLYVFGGLIDSAYSNSKSPLWLFDTVKERWLHLQDQSSPSQEKDTCKHCHVMPSNRKGHSAVVMESSMYIYGGYIDMRGTSQEFWRLDLDTGTWSLLSNAPVGPGPRHSHSAMTHQDCMYLYGGLQGLKEQRDLWRWSFHSQAWSCIRASSGPSKLMGHSAVVYKDSMLLFGGGETQSAPRNCLWRFNLTTLTWEKLPSLPGSIAPCRVHHSSVGLGPAFQPEPPSTNAKETLMSNSLNNNKLRPFKNKCFPSRSSTWEPGEDIELQAVHTVKTKGLKDISPALKKTKQWKNCLTFENQEAIGEVQEGELSAEEMEDDLAHPMPDLLLVLGGRPLKEQGAISVWQMTLNES
ncbi:kelch domain-containing protein 3 [Astyanax mexicanus]|uniref:kelch domain-containing protein 3 n=1 Tax=Astyanax mexicanus TaxID=7994 RepID=UPI0020CADF31|nr:kelch domain-containing protein 3 [Astyanax mexicanus]XP_007227957.3 kelch domain-containing protein 3 [Astyanax mexicanus]XP_049341190.1 kelch domain-containing protein 3 [Astyanax mexicanus]